MSIVFITHDLGVVADIATASSSCTRAARSRRHASEIFACPHPLHRGLLDSIPRLAAPIALPQRSKASPAMCLIPLAVPQAAASSRAAHANSRLPCVRTALEMDGADGRGPLAAPANPARRSSGAMTATAGPPPAKSASVREPLLAVRRTSTNIFPIRGAAVRAERRPREAVDGVAFDVRTGEVLGAGR